MEDLNASRNSVNKHVNDEKENQLLRGGTRSCRCHPPRFRVRHANEEETDTEDEEADRHLVIFISYASIILCIIFVSIYSSLYLHPFAAILCFGCALALGFVVRNLYGYIEWGRRRDGYHPV